MLTQFKAIYKDREHDTQVNTSSLIIIYDNEIIECNYMCWYRFKVGQTSNNLRFEMLICYIDLIITFAQKKKLLHKYHMILHIKNGKMNCNMTKSVWPNV